MKKSNINVIRAWKDPAYRASLSEKDRAALPENPAGTMELTDEELGHVEGGYQLSRVANFKWARAIQIQPSWVDACPSAMGCTFDAVRLTVTNPQLMTRG